MPLVAGLHKFQCHRCGATYKSDKQAVEWTGAIVCRGTGTNNCYDPRHPQDLIMMRRVEDVAVENARPMNWQAISVNTDQNTAIVGLAIVGLAVVGVSYGDN